MPSRFEELQHYLDQGFSFVLSGEIICVYAQPKFLSCVDLYSGDNYEHAFLACEAWLESKNG